MARVAKRRDRYVLDFYDNQGKRQRKTLRAGTTLKRAKEKLREIEDQLNAGTWLPEEKVPKFKKVAIDWLEHKRQSLRASTWSVYEGHTRNHFDDFDNLKVSRITTARLEKWMNTKKANGMHILTLRKVCVTLGQIFAYAVRHGYAISNPLTNAERPRDTNGGDEKKIRILSPDEINAFLNATEGQKYKTLFRLAIMSGARQGELLGLKWTDILWTVRQVHIQRTFNNGTWYSPKTRKSKRKIDLGPAMMQDLRRWRMACPKNELELVFPNFAGQPINHSNMRSRHFYPTLKAADLGKMRFHDLRHTYTSLLFEQGENIKYIQSQLGHSSPTVTLNVYAHLMHSTNQAAAQRLENGIFGVPQNSTGHNLVTNNDKGPTSQT